MHIFLPLNKKTRIYGFIAIYIMVFLFIVSPDSYTHDLFNRADSSVFFMCGKAWMNGMIPYVDYTDSKGPLLWLIYGIGYLISHYDYIGVFWLSCIMYLGVFYYIFKTANLYLNSNHLALFCVLLMSLCLFNPWFHYEIRAEDWCQIFIIVAIYRMSLHLYSEQNASYILSSFLLGVCFAGPILIKYNISIMMGTIMLYALFYFIRSRKNIFIAFISFILGVSTILLPFVLYFCYIGNFDDFINEYFLNTFKTVQDSNSIGTYIHELLTIFANPAEAILFVISIIGSVLFANNVEKDKYFPLLTIIGFWSIAIHHGIIHYFSICTLFPIWFITSLLHYMRNYFLINYKKKVLCFSICIMFFCTLWNYTFTSGFLLRNLFFYDNNDRTDYYHVAQIMSQVQNPTLIYMHFTVGHGEGTPVGILPGSKYFFSQLGATQEMERIQREDVRNGKADFVIIASHLLSDSEKAILSEGNYKKCSEYHYWLYCYYVYTKHSIIPPVNSLHMSNFDVLLKNNHFKK